MKVGRASAGCKPAHRIAWFSLGGPHGLCFPAGSGRTRAYPRSMTDATQAAPELVASEGAALGSSDHTRRWALRFPDGAVRFPGVTRIEGFAAAAALAGQADPGRALVQVTLPVVLSDGAGPHLVDADGRLVLALGPHPHVAGASVAMGEAAPDHVVGLVEPAGGGGGLWRWVARARVAAEGRVAALDAIDAAPDRDAASRWERDHRG